MRQTWAEELQIKHTASDVMKQRPTLYSTMCWACHFLSKSAVRKAEQIIEHTQPEPDGQVKHQGCYAELLTCILDVRGQMASPLL